MKIDLLELIDQTENVENLFHVLGGVSGPTFSNFIYDVQEFNDWIQGLQFEFQSILENKPHRFVEGALKLVNAKFDGMRDETHFKEIKGCLATIKKNIDQFYSDNELQLTMNKEPRVFISHSTKDSMHTDLIVRLLKSMGMQDSQIFCSSVPGYDIPIGNDIFGFLKEQFYSYNLHVLFVHSVNYYASPVSLNEMGAAWVLKNCHTSILLPGFPFSDMSGVVGYSEIAIKLDANRTEVKDKLNQLKDNLASEFHFEATDGIIWERSRDQFIADSISVKNSDEQGKPSEHKSSIDSDMELTEAGYYIKQSDKSAGKNIRYCAACYQNTGKCYPYTKGSMARDMFCTNCKGHISR